MLGAARSHSAFIVRNAYTTESDAIPLSSLPSEQFPNARTQDKFKVFEPSSSMPVRQESPFKKLTRSRSMTSSGSKLFQKARSVEKRETFLSKKPVKADLDYRHASKKKLKSHLQTDKYDKVNSIVERKLMISKVLTNNKNSESKLSIRE